MDLVGKGYGVPCYQLLGGKFWDKVRIYGDTPSPDDIETRAFDIIHPDMLSSGGLTETKKIFDRALDVPWWTDMVTGIAPDNLADSYVSAPETPGLGIDLNEDVMRAQLATVS